jgi:hypothetical protein
VREGPQEKPLDYGVESELRRRVGAAFHDLDVEPLIGRS